MKYDRTRRILSINEDHKTYTAHRRYDHLSEDLLDAFAHFMDNSAVMSRSRVLSHQVQRLEHAQTVVSGEVLEGINSERDEWLHTLQERFDTEANAVRDTLQRQLEEDIRALKYNNQRLLDIELERLHAAHTTRTTAVSHFFDREEAHLQQNVFKAWQSEVVALQEQHKATKEQLDAIFPIRVLPRMFILAEDLEAHALLEACIERTGTTPGCMPYLAQNPAWTSRMLSPETVTTTGSGGLLRDVALTCPCHCCVVLCCAAVCAAVCTDVFGGFRSDGELGRAPDDCRRPRSRQCRC